MFQKMLQGGSGGNPKLQYKNGTGTIVNHTLSITNIGFKPLGIILSGTYVSSGNTYVLSITYMLIDENVILQAYVNNIDASSHCTVTLGENDLTIQQTWTGSNVTCKYTIIGM